MILYDFIAPLVGHVSRWNAHLERIEAMGFSAVKFSPLYSPGCSIRAYTAYSYDVYHPLFFGDVGAGEAERLFRETVDRARALDLDVILDTAIHQMASDSPLIDEHPEWFGENAESTPEGAVAFDYANHGEEIAGFHAERIKKFLALGVDGFRARNAHQVEGRWWSQLIDAARSDHPKAIFLAEMFGISEENQGSIAGVGFNLVFNSFHWWNLVDEWYGRQQRILSEYAKTLCPVELSDTPRVAAGCGSVKEVAQQRYLISAAMGANIATGLGFEYGFNRSPDPCTCSPADWEEPRYDISSFIAHVNRFRRSEPGLHVDGPIETTSMLRGPLRLVSKPLENRRGRVWTIINTDMENRTWGVAETDLPTKRAFRWTGGGEIEPCNPLDLPQHFDPAEVRILFDE